MAFGLFDNILIYSKWLKRRSQSNIILGGFSGGAPALIGYIAVTTQNIEIGLVMAGLVFLWIPTHIWSLALHVKKDYTRADRSEEHTSELQSRQYLVCRLLLEKKKNITYV